MESRTKAMIFFQFCDLSFNKYKFFPTILKYLLKKSARPKSIFQSIYSYNIQQKFWFWTCPLLFRPRLRPQPSPHPVFGILGYQPRSRFFFEKFSVLFLISVFLGFSVFSRFFCLKLEFSRFVMIKLVFSRFCFWKFLGFIFNLDFSHVFFYLFPPFFFLENSRFFFKN